MTRLDKYAGVPTSFRRVRRREVTHLLEQATMVRHYYLFGGGVVIVAGSCANKPASAQRRVQPGKRPDVGEPDREAVQIWLSVGGKFTFRS